VGVVPDLADLPGMVTALARRGDLTGAVVHAGVVPSLLAACPGLPCGLVIDLFGGTWLSPLMDCPNQICSLEHAVRSGADGVMGLISLGGLDEWSRLRVCGQIARECAAWGLPFVVRVDTFAAGARQFSAVLAGQGARMAYELGADLVVVNYSGSPQTFHEAL